MHANMCRWAFHSPQRLGSAKLKILVQRDQRHERQVISPYAMVRQAYIFEADFYQNRPWRRVIPSCPPRAYAPVRCAARGFNKCFTFYDGEHTNETPGDQIRRAVHSRLLGGRWLNDGKVARCQATPPNCAWLHKQWTQASQGEKGLRNKKLTAQVALFRWGKSSKTYSGDTSPQACWDGKFYSRKWQCSQIYWCTDQDSGSF